MNASIRDKISLNNNVTCIIDYTLFAFCRYNTYSNINAKIELEWPNLQWLSLRKHWCVSDNNNIGNNGVKLLSKTNMP